MRRVYFMWFGRMVLNPASFKAVAFALLMMEFAKEVHVRAVLENSPSLWNVPQSALFLQSALVGTNAFVQIALAGMALLALFLARDIAKDRIFAYSKLA
jgi:hypothetical protein